jgi:universal stress protein A
MRIGKILVPTDYSESSEQALDYATAVARDTGATIVLVNVAEPLPMYGEIPYYALQMPNGKELERRLNAIEIDPKIPTERHVLVGMAAERILDQAAKDQVDLIVLGTHGRTGVSRVLMGSVAELVVRRAPCPVLTLKAVAPTPAAT